MERRHFFKLLGAATAALVYPGCAVTVQGTEGNASPPDDTPAPRDANTLYVDAATAPVEASVAAGFTILESFSVLLNDATCSGHSHTLAVIAGTYPPDTLVRFLGGSHLVELYPSELLQLQRGERIPFATTGQGPGHGHCGTAWRMSVGPAEPHRAESCVLRNTTATCEARHS